MTSKKKYSHPVQILQTLESRCRKNARGLPQQEEIRDEWRGIGFRVGDLNLVAPLGQAIEILTFPEMSRVPGAKHWVMGIANIRGNLLPVMDLKQYLLGQQTSVRKKSRVLVMKRGQLFSGLLVDEVLGMRSFLAENRRVTPANINADVKPYIEHIYKHNNQQWLVFSMHKLAESPLFMQVAS